MVILACAFEGCAFVTSALVILQSHVYGHAQAADRSSNGGSHTREISSAPKLDRPQIDVGVSIEQWQVFVRRWEVFKHGAHIDDASAAPQLFQCATQELGDTLLKSDAHITTKPLADLLTQMKKLAVILTATGVLRSELLNMQQSRNEPVRSFAARVRGKADACMFTTKCSCGTAVNYTDHMIRDTLLNGIYDADIQREILGMSNIIFPP